MPVKIVNLKAENFKRLEAVEIDADDYVQFIGGRNSQGKSSVLDAIFLALGGGVAGKSVKKPVRIGQEEAKVVVDLGTYVVTKEWKNDKATLKIESKDGAKYANPQAFLDKCLGAIAFDPLMFMRLSAKEQKEELLRLVDLDINVEANDIARKTAYDKRTEVGREVTRLEGHIAGLGEIEVAPEEEVSAQDLIARIRVYELEDRGLHNLTQLRANCANDIKTLQGKLDDAQDSLSDLDASIAGYGPVEPLAPLEAQLAEVEVTNAKVRKNKERMDSIARITVVKEGYANLNDEIKSIDETKADALAKAKFPVAGLGFDEDGVTFNAIPLINASDSEKIRVAIGIAMALNSEIRIIRISDGSLLDSETIGLITQMAQDKDYQLWIETVGDNGVGVIIEDGKILKDYSKS